MGDRRDAYRVLVAKTEGKRQLGRPRSRWGCNIQVDLQDTRLIDLVEDRGNWQSLVNAVMNLRVPYISRIFLNI
jgi:hypothetical protein